MTTDEKISLLEILTELALTEANLIWTRFSAILYASTGLLGILAFAVERGNDVIPVFTAGFGLLLSVVWLQTIRLSSFYYQRWQTDADYLISQDEHLKEIVRGRLAPRVEKPRGWTASKYSMLVPIGFSILWLVVIIDALGFISIL